MMKNRKAFKIGLICMAATLTAAAGIFAGCESHTHTYSDGWAFDAEAHWHPTTCEHDAKDKKTAHVFNDVEVASTAYAEGYTMHVCACGYTYIDCKTDPTGGTPVTDSQWQYDDTKHWQTILGGKESDVVYTNHEYATSVVAPTCSEAGYTLHACTTCAYWYRDTLVDPTGSHSFDANGWAHDSASHWHPATCCAIGKQGEEAHDFTVSVVKSTHESEGYTAYVCKVCGYVERTNVVPQGHTYADTWSGDEYTHWNAAVCSGHTEEKANVADHALVGSSPVCVVCGQSVSPRLEYKLNADGNSYTVTGLGCINSNTITIPAEYRGKKVSAISPKAFAGTGITSLTISATEGGVYLPDGFCAGCTSLTSVTVQGSALSAIPTDAFNGCTSLQTVNVPNTYTEIGARAFKDCAALTTLSSSVCLKRIGEKAFDGVSVVTTVGGVQYVASIAIGYDGSVSDVVIQNNTSMIVSGVFTGSAALRSITVPAGVTLPNNFCNGCTNLTSVTLADRTDIPVGAFRGCENLSSFTLPESCKTIGDFAFTGCGNVAFDLSALTSLESVGFSAFNSCISITNGALPASLKFIDEYAFAHCTGIHELTLPEHAVINGQAFIDCRGLTTLTANCAQIPASAFEGCTALSSVTLSNNKVTAIGDAAFKDCSSLASLAIPDSVNYVGAGAFTGTGLITTTGGVKYASNVIVGYEGSLASVTVTNTVIGIADGAFRGCTSLNSVNLSSASALRFIGASAFRGCTGVSAVTIPASVTRIGAHAFRESGLTSVTVPATVKTVGDNAFYDCRSLRTVTVNAENIGKFAFSYTGVNRTLNSPVKERPDYAKINSVTIGATVKTIGSNAFQYCPVTAIVIPEGVTHVGAYAFAQTDTANVKIAASVTYIGEYAFYETRLAKATFESKTGWTAGKTALTESAFNTTANSATLLKTTYVDQTWTKA